MRRLTIRTALAIVMAAVTLAVPVSVGASDVNLGSPTTIDELLASPEYVEDEHGDVARLYRAFLNRVPDVGGLVYWIGEYEDGATMVELAWLFGASPEFTNTYGSNLADTQFLEIVYSNVLGRGYDQAGFDYWLSELQAGLSRPETVLWIVAGDEFRTEYPFAGTYPDIVSALLTSDDLPAAFTERDEARYTIASDEVEELTACDRYRVLNSNTYSVYNGTADGSEIVTQDFYAFSDENDAIQAFAEFEKVAPNCQTVITDFPDGRRLTETYALGSGSLGIGDESLSLISTWDWGIANARYDFALFVVRNGNVVTVTDHTSAVGPVNAAIGEALAQLTSDRVESLLAE